MLSSIDDALNLFGPGDTLYIPGASSEPRAFVTAISEAAFRLGRLHIINGFVSGINTVPLASEHNQLSETVFFPRPLQHKLPGRITLLPLSYYGVNNFLAGTPIDWAVVHLSAPDQQGNCSLGVSAEFQPGVIARAKRTLGIVNKRMPRVPGSVSLPAEQFDYLLEMDSPLMTYTTGEADEVSEKIAHHIQNLIDSGAVLQTGLGKVPDKLLASLSHHRNLRFHSGMISDGFLGLLDAGALDPDFTHATCCALGSEDFYRRLTDVDCLKILGVDQTHAPQTLSRFENLVAINSALEVDLFGQANLEMTGGKQVSNVGGAADFSRAASQSRHGKSIIALPATAGNGKFSRIVARLDSRNMVSLPRYDVDYVVTEYGVAQLKNRSLAERAEALIGIAAPEFRDSLANQAEK